MSNYDTPELHGVAHAVVAAAIGVSVQGYDAQTAKLNTAQEYTAAQNFDATALLSSTGHIAWNLNANQVTKHTMTENTILDNPTNMKDGGTYRITITQHASSAKTLGFGSVYKWPGGTAPTLSVGASAVDIFEFSSDGVSMNSKGIYQVLAAPA